MSNDQFQVMWTQKCHTDTYWDDDGTNYGWCCYTHGEEHDGYEDFSAADNAAFAHVKTAAASLIAAAEARGRKQAADAIVDLLRRTREGKATQNPVYRGGLTTAWEIAREFAAEQDSG